MRPWAKVVRDQFTRHVDFVKTKSWAISVEFMILFL